MVDTERHSTRLGKAFAGILKRGIEDYTSEDLGVDDVKGLKGWFQKQRGKAEDAVKSSVVEAFTDPEVQEIGAEGVQRFIRETVDDVRGDFKGTVHDAAESLGKHADNETRSKFEQIRGLLGYKKTDKWYVKIGKNMLAHLGRVGLPIAGIISAKLAARFSGDTSSSDVKDYRKNFDRIYDGALAKASEARPAKT